MRRSWKRNHQPTNTLKEYDTVFVDFPFENLSTVEIVALPYWRLLSDDCIVAFNPRYIYMDVVFQMITAWDLRYVYTTPMHKDNTNPIVLAVRGHPDKWFPITTTNYVKGGGVHKVLGEWGRNKLAINVKPGHNRRALYGWDRASATGSATIDPYRYPLRKNGIDIDESLVDYIDSIRQEWRNSKLAKWKCLEKLAIILVQSKLPKSKVYELVREATDYELKRTSLIHWGKLIEKIHADEIKIDMRRPIETYIAEIHDTYRHTNKRE